LRKKVASMTVLDSKVSKKKSAGKPEAASCWQGRKENNSRRYQHTQNPKAIDLG
jgi:hypothetical protein